jgi:hypothetical protein
MKGEGQGSRGRDCLEMRHLRGEKDFGLYPVDNGGKYTRLSDSQFRKIL